MARFKVKKSGGDNRSVLLSLPWLARVYSHHHRVLPIPHRLEARVAHALPHGAIPPHARFQPLKRGEHISHAVEPRKRQGVYEASLHRGA